MTGEIIVNPEIGENNDDNVDDCNGYHIEDIYL